MRKESKAQKALSVSRIQCFNQCKYKFRLSYIDKVEQERFDFFKKGSKIHSEFEKLARENIDSVKTSPDSSTVVKNFLVSTTGKKHLETILDSQREVRVGLKIEDNKVIPCGYNDKDCFFHGIIDVLNLKEKTILDYKTGSRKTYKDQDWTQLEYYSAWLFLNSDFDEIKISYLYVEHNHENSKVIKREELNGILKRILTNAIEIKAFNENPSEEHNVSWMCEYCSCKKHCKFFQETKGLENIEFETF